MYESPQSERPPDADGVALAAIQGLNQKLEQALKAQQSRIEALEERLIEIERKLTRLAGKTDLQ